MGIGRWDGEEVLINYLFELWCLSFLLDLFYLYYIFNLPMLLLQSKFVNIGHFGGRVLKFVKG